MHFSRHSRFYDRSVALNGGRAAYRGFSGQTGAERWVATSAPAVMDLLAVKRPWVSGETAKSLTPLTFCCSGDLFWLGWWSLRCCQPGIIDTVCPEVKANGAGFMQGCSAQVEKTSRDYYQTLHNVTWRLNQYELTAASRVRWSPFNINTNHKRLWNPQSINQPTNSIAKCKLAALRKNSKLQDVEEKKNCEM